MVGFPDWVVVVPGQRMGIQVVVVTLQYLRVQVRQIRVVVVVVPIRS
jgi:hypothetical protein